MLGRLYLWKIGLFTVPMVAFAGLCFYALVIYRSYDDGQRYPEYFANDGYIAAFLVFVFGLAAYPVGVAFVSFAVETCAFSGIAYVGFHLFSARFNSGKARAVFWSKAFAFMTAGKCAKDRLLRTVLVN
jgi:hypothetical protein